MLSISQVIDPLVAVLGFALFVYARKLLGIFKNGRMEKSFILFVIAPVFLTISNAYETLAGFNFLPDLNLVWNLQLDDFATIAFIITLFLGFFELLRAWQPKKPYLETRPNKSTLPPTGV